VRRGQICYRVYVWEVLGTQETGLWQGQLDLEGVSVTIEKA
jgi:hypothetical protein